MATGHDESSSDVARARALSRRLTPPDAPPPRRGVPGATPASAYVRFDASKLGAAEAKHVGVRRSTPPPEGSDWSGLLDWVRTNTGAEAVFLGTASGLLVALAGEMPRERAEAMGARLVLAFENADAMEADSARSRFLVLDFGGAVLSGLRVELSEGEPLVLGVAGPFAVDAVTRLEIERAVAEKARA